MSLAGHAAIGIVNPDGSVTHIAPHPQVTAQVATSIGTPLKSVSQAGQTVSLAGGTQIVTLSPGSAGSGYSIIQPQQMQTISIDGQEAIYIPASSLSGGQQAIQIGNQIISPSSIVARGGAAGAGQNQQHQQVIQGNVQFAQLGSGQTVAVRQAGTNVLQTIQMPMQQSIPIQIPISTSNGQTVYQTIHLPLQTLQAISAGNVTAQVVPQMSQVQVGGHQLQVTQQPGANAGNQIKQEPGLESSQSATQTTTTTSSSNTGQTVVANVQLPNGQIGQIVQTMVQQPQQIAWSGSTINLGNLTGQSGPPFSSSDPSFRCAQCRDCRPACSSSRSSLRVPGHCRV